MRVTKVTFYAKDHCKKALGVCSVVLCGELRLNDIALYKNEKGYFLVFPSRQDVYQDIVELNGSSVTLPKNTGARLHKKYEEFYHPVSSDFYDMLLSAVIAAYNKLH